MSSVEVLCFAICSFQCIGLLCARGVLELSVLWNIAVYSIDWAQKTAGLYKISNHPLVSLMVSASQRLLGRPKAKKDPATPELMLKARVESKITDKSLSISDLRSVA